MAHRRLLNNGIRVAAAMALVVSVMSSPIRPIHPTTTVQPDHFRVFGMPKGHTTHHRAPAPLHSRVLVVKAVRAETEDRLSETAGRAPLLFFSPPALSSGVVSSGNRLEIVRATHPLRC